ncbi:hypothetical protein HNP11_000250 [Tsukamurella ocularis]|nr:hypothetical protein [Tsukamurella ocularis]MCS3786097.1 hypothetical protein [Tsukamurella ocularis]MCS3849461.1 hypothetical protein [Tsukamurella ocularis]
MITGPHQSPPYHYLQQFLSVHDARSPTLRVAPIAAEPSIKAKITRYQIYSASAVSPFNPLTHET